MKLSLFLQKPGIFAKTGNLCKNRESLQKPGIFAKTGNLCKNRESLQKPGIFAKTGNLCKNRESLQKPGIYKSRFLYKITGFFVENCSYPVYFKNAFKSIN